MKRIYTLILILFVFDYSLSVASELSGSYKGTVVGSKFLYNAYLEIYGSSYNLSIYMDKKNNEFDIPDQYFKKIGGYYSYEERGSYKTQHEGQLSYMFLESETGFTCQSKLGFLNNNRRLYLYNLSNKLYYDSNDGLKLNEVMPWIDSVMTSSFLVEGENTYNGKNLNLSLGGNIGLPWVESESGQGIGEWIEIKCESIGYPVSSFLISNGYVNFGKPYLYKYNSRIKKMRITSKDKNIDFVVELKDTPNFQEIRLPKKITDLKITFRFTILEVYPGTKWEDTCLNLIIPLGDLPDEK